ncbi:serine/threonine-protein phosphatase [Variovorax sp. PAMC28562]|uniref:PP2C family protein-serine/threonine phosphatase n=1 Tax=Variovorax sp. PAMC28562 TaxID=2762323 RepID=UPI00164ECC99|nr:protein phosphatase 2C domain-containing protein [Variovorax sp. PAMC28562]QNK72195.1 serine/threonine-protein phosphatase [Variovorax sp. PAMC28562]
MRVLTEQFSLTGKNKINEDAIGFREENNLHVAAIADGVGGNDGGATASAIAIMVAIDSISKVENLPFLSIFSDAAAHIKLEAQLDLINANMATTLSMCQIDSLGRCRVGHVGDSRIYHLRGTGILQKTVDQTEVAALIDAGILTKSQAKTYPRRTVLTSALSSKGNFDLYEAQFSTISGDRLIFLTDGIYRILGKKKICETSVSFSDLADFSKALKNLTYGKNDDDASALILEIN